jgi:hypothetical protein
VRQRIKDYNASVRARRATDPEYRARENAREIKSYRKSKLKPEVMRRRREYGRRRHYLLKYGLTEEQVESLLREQGSCCAICRVQLETGTRKVDHSHATGKVRGILCHNCNLGLGYFSDDPDRMASAIFYLVRAHNAEQPASER